MEQNEVSLTETIFLICLILGVIYYAFTDNKPTEDLSKIKRIIIIEE